MSYFCFYIYKAIRKVLFLPFFSERSYKALIFGSERSYKALIFGSERNFNDEKLTSCHRS